MLWLGRTTIFNRAARLISAEDISSVIVPGDGLRTCFTCFIAAGGADVPEEQIRDFADRLLQAGCACLYIWGEHGERWKQPIDEAIAAALPHLVTAQWQNGETLEDALAYFFTCTIPDIEFPVCESALLICPPQLARELSSLARQWLK